MAVEIRELIIRAEVKYDAEPKKRETEKGDTSLDQDELVQACVKEVMKILKRQERR